MSDKIKLALPLIVEGRYDKSTLSGFVEGVILTTGGFSVFNNKEQQALLRRLCREGAIVLTDSDGGGRQIRSFLSGILPPDNIHHIFIPRISGKEGRKKRPSKAGTLGVEGMEKDVLMRLLLPFSTDEKARNEQKMITKVDFFEDNLTGGERSSERRAALCALCDLPEDMTAKALLEALNLLYGFDEYKRLVALIGAQQQKESEV